MAPCLADDPVRVHGLSGLLLLGDGVSRLLRTSGFGELGVYRTTVVVLL